jgi:hypothetical protein
MGYSAQAICFNGGRAATIIGGRATDERVICLGTFVDANVETHIDTSPQPSQEISFGIDFPVLAPNGPGAASVEFPLADPKLTWLPQLTNSDFDPIAEVALAYRGTWAATRSWRSPFSVCA